VSQPKANTKARLHRGRQYSYFVDARAGCFQCHGSEAHWLKPNAQAIAARHHDATGHTTWVETMTGIRYGDPSRTEQEVSA
jgi:cytochrome c551/c552